MIIFSLRALWKGLKGRSLTFSVVFAMAVLGSSFAGILRMPLRYVGLWAPLIFILPIVATGLLAKQERRLKIDEQFKRICSYSLIFGSILLALLIWKYEGWQEDAYADSFQPGPNYREPVAQPVRRAGPRGRP